MLYITKQNAEKISAIWQKRIRKSAILKITKSKDN